jgi:hypothetical protein
VSPPAFVATRTVRAASQRLFRSRRVRQGYGEHPSDALVRALGASSVGPSGLPRGTLMEWLQFAI